jgi:uncharacterized protein with HXXEE motif
MSFGLPWLAINTAFALHVLDEATSDFLAWYNPRALAIRRALGGLPFPPTFTFWPWLLGLIAAVAALFAMSPAAFHGAPWLRSVAVVVGVIQAGNGLLHLTAAAVTRRRVPGLWSAPILLAAAAWLLVTLAGPR